MAAYKEAMLAVCNSEWAKVRIMVKEILTDIKGDQQTNLSAKEKE